MGYCGAHDQTARQSTLVMVDDAANLRHPPQWFVRTEWYAVLNPAPFFSEEAPFGPQQVIRLRYAVVVASGAADADRGEELAELGRAALRGWD